MGKSINPIWCSFNVQGEAVAGSALGPIVLMSLQPAIPRRVALLQSPPPLYRLDCIYHSPAETVNHHLERAGEFSTGILGNFQLVLTFVRAGGFFENFLFGLQAAQGGTLPVFYDPTNRKSTMVATNDIGSEVAELLTGPTWSGHRVIELGSMVSADEVAEQLGEVLNRDVKAFAVPRAGWAEAFEQFGVPKGRTGPAEEMFESVNAGWMRLGITGAEHVAGTTSARDVFAAAQNAVEA